MNISNFIECLNREGLIESIYGDRTVEVNYITYDSRLVNEDTLFVCKGVAFKRQYLIDAVSYGASAYVSELDYNVENCTAIIVNDIRKAMSVISHVYYGDIDKKIKIAGITGTKGKSTTTFFAKTIIDEYLATTGLKTAICSGIYNYDGGEVEASHLTTPENIELFGHIARAVDARIPYMVMEVSSQALKYGRVDNVHYDVSCFLNISRDHISPVEHPTFEDYLKFKMKIFRQSKVACVNLDCDYSDRILEAAKCAERVITFSQNDSSADVYAYNVSSNRGKVTFDANICGDARKIELAAFGKINVENAIAAIAVTHSLGIPVEHILKGLAKAVVPGRMELLTSDDGNRMALVDYAHNKLSFEKLFTSLKQEFPERDIVVVCGCVGGRAYERRKDVPETVAKYAKLLIITEVDYGNEDPCDICEEIASYAKRAGANYEIIINREMAIKRAVKLADSKTIVIAAGKGNETTMKRGDYNVPILSDAEVIKKYIN